MGFTKKLDGSTLTVIVEGKLNTSTAPELDRELKASLDGIEKLIFDFSKTDYISSAGLRILTASQITMNRQGTMVITGVNEIINEIFDITGLKSILTIR